MIFEHNLLQLKAILFDRLVKIQPQHQPDHLRMVQLQFGDVCLEVVDVLE